MASDRDFARLMRFFEEELASLRAKHDELERKHNNLFREASVTKLHENDGMVELDADGLSTDKIPWLARAGKQREWDPPTEGERVILISISGDPAQGLVLPGGFSNKFPMNHNKAGEHRRSVGDKVSTTTTDKDKVSRTEKVVVSQNEDNHEVKAGNTRFATLQDKNVSEAPKTVVSSTLLVASGGVA